MQEARMPMGAIHLNHIQVKEGPDLAIYIGSLANSRGAQRTIYSLVRGLTSRGYRVDLLLDRGGGWMIDALQKEFPNIRVVTFPDAKTWNLQNLLLTLRADFKHLFSMSWNERLRRYKEFIALLDHACSQRTPLASFVRYLKEHEPKNVMSFLTDHSITAMLAASLDKGRTRFIVNVRNHVTTSSVNGKSRRSRNMRGLIRTTFPYADKIVAVSDGVRKDLETITGLPRDRFVTLYNPVYRADLLKDAEEPVDHPWFSDSSIPVIVCAAKFKKQKDLPTLFKAFALARAKRPLRLILLGEGPDALKVGKICQDLGIANDVYLAGQVRNPYSYFARASLFVLSSIWEGLPNTLIEAMSCGCPVVSTDCPTGPNEILEGGKYGRLVPVGDAEALSSAILDTLRFPPPRATLVSRASAFSYESAIDAYEQTLFGRVTSSKPALATPDEEVCVRAS